MFVNRILSLGCFCESILDWCDFVYSEVLWLAPDDFCTVADIALECYFGAAPLVDIASHPRRFADDSLSIAFRTFVWD
jgi:hypothetical protein